MLSLQVSECRNPYHNDARLTTMNSFVGLITARGGSKGIPKKNVKELCGKPLIAWTIEAALRCKGLQRLILSTDDEEIAAISRRWGADVPFLRPAVLAQDSSPHIDTLLHAIEWLREHEGHVPDYIVLLQPTSPLRTSEDIDAGIAIAQQHSAPAVVSVCEVKPHPYLSCKLAGDGTLYPLMTTDLGDPRRQDLPAAYAPNGALYVNKTMSLLNDQTFLPAGTLPYLMPPKRSIDVDTDWDFELAELVLRHLLESVKVSGGTAAP